MDATPNSSLQPGVGIRRNGMLARERLWVHDLAGDLAEDLGDTDTLVRGRAAFAEPDAGDINEMLQTVELALTASPQRADLWTARFRLYANFGMKTEFARAMEI